MPRLERDGVESPSSLLIHLLVFVCTLALSLLTVSTQKLSWPNLMYTCLQSNLKWVYSSCAQGHKYRHHFSCFSLKGTVSICMSARLLSFTWRKKRLTRSLVNHDDYPVQEQWPWTTEGGRCSFTFWHDQTALIQPNVLEWILYQTKISTEPCGEPDYSCSSPEHLKWNFYQAQKPKKGGKLTNLMCVCLCVREGWRPIILLKNTQKSFFSLFFLNSVMNMCQ